MKLKKKLFSVFQTHSFAYLGGGSVGALILVKNINRCVAIAAYYGWMFRYKHHLTTRVAGVTRYL